MYEYYVVCTGNNKYLVATIGEIIIAESFDFCPKPEWIKDIWDNGKVSPIAVGGYLYSVPKWSMYKVDYKWMKLKGLPFFEG